MEKSESKVYSIEEIRKIAPGYRGKPENFNPAKAGKKVPPKQSQTRAKGVKKYAADISVSTSEANTTT
jgi:hypothetical protein